MSASTDPPGGTRLERLIHHHDLTAAYKAKIETYAGNGTFNISDDAFMDFVAAFVAQDGPQTLYAPGVLRRLQEIRSERPVAYHKAATQLRGVKMPDGNKPWWPDVEAALDALPVITDDFPDPITATALLAKDIPPQNFLIEPLLHDGITLFAGKSKRGKSWIMLDLAMAVAVGRGAFQHYRTKQAPVLYLALEDGERRVKNRLLQIQPNLAQMDDLHIYTDAFPRINSGFVETLTAKIVKFGFQLVIVDVLAKILPRQGPRQRNEYLDVYEHFEGLQQLCKQRDIAMVFLDHLRKAEAEDHFENINGSTGKQGVADALWVLERKPKDDLAFLHIRDKDTEDTTIGVEFSDGHWEYLGEGEEFERDREEQTILKILHEEQREMQIPDIMKAAGWVGDARYARLRKVLIHMVKDDLIHRTQHGKYSATIRGSIRYDKDDGIPF